MKKARSVIIFSQEYPPFNWGGVTPFAVNLVNGLRALGLQVQLITISEKEEVEVQSNGVIIHKVASTGIYKDEIFQTNNGLKRHYRFLKRAKNLDAKLGKPDVVVLADGLCFPEAKACALYYEIPLITMVNQIFSDVASLWDKDLDGMVSLEKQYFEGSNSLVVGSKYMQQRMKKLGLEHKSSHINYGWGFQNWSSRERADNVSESDFIFVGRMVPEKGILTLINAFKRVVDACPNCSLRLVGDGPVRQKAYQKVCDLGIKNNVEFIGHVSWVSIGDVFQTARFCIVPSYNEPFGYVALEAVMYGALPIMSDACGLRETAECIPYPSTVKVDEVSEFVFVPDEEALAQAMLESLMLSEEERVSICDKARIVASQKYNYITTSSEWVQLMNAVVNSPVLV